MFGKHNVEGHINFNSTIISKPSYTFGKRHSLERVVNLKNSADFLGKDSPGVGHYRYEANQSFTANRSHHQPGYFDRKNKKTPTMFGNEERFF